MRTLPAMLVVLAGGTAVIGATFCAPSNHSSCTDCGGDTPRATSNPSSGGGTPSAGGTASDPGKPDTGMARNTPPKTTTPPEGAPVSDACPTTTPKLLDQCDDASGRGCTYGDKSGTCNNLYYCFEGVWAAAKQTMRCGAGQPDVCPSSISPGAVCKPGSASDVVSWTSAGAYPCILQTGSVCTCDADLPCGAMAPPPGGSAPTSGKWNCTPPSPCPVRPPVQGAACARQEESCSYRRFCDVTTATCSGGHWSLAMTQAAP